MEFFATQSLRTNTWRNYRQSFSKFEEMCKQLNYSHTHSKPLSEDEFCFVVIAFAHSHKVSTLPGFLSGIRAMVKVRRLPNLPDGDRLHKVVTGISKWFSIDNVIRRAASVSTEHIQQLAASMDLSSFVTVRDFCAYVFAFLAVLRISEYTGQNSLCWRHVQLSRKQGITAITLTIPFSKTASSPVQVVIVSQPDSLCPVKAFDRYRKLAGKVQPDWPLFLHEPNKKKPMSKQPYIRRLRQRLTTIGVTNADKFTGHSFRRGGLTALILAGVTETQAQRHGRWSSNSFKKYFDTEFSFEAQSAATTTLASRSSAENNRTHMHVAATQWPP